MLLLSEWEEVFNYIDSYIETMLDSPRYVSFIKTIDEQSPSQANSIYNLIEENITDLYDVELSDEEKLALYGYIKYRASIVKDNFFETTE